MCVCVCVCVCAHLENKTATMIPTTMAIMAIKATITPPTIGPASPPVVAGVPTVYTYNQRYVKWEAKLFFIYMYIKPLP